MTSATDTIRAYYDAFNAGDMDRFLSLLTEDVAHDINQGERQVGKAAFAKFMDHMNRCYKEELTEMVVMATEDGTRGAAEFIVNGTYLATDEGLPEANGQTYRLPAGAFFELKDGKVARISNYYSLPDWIAQVGG
ncbi:ketosteroid isomerase-related protein [Rhizobium sp. G187]|uniref:ketosteroid isomerase-related protein n=1 Tax=unclassified Rhizobium TaxID=2613769 RepID=UPI0006B99A37|nr:ketosteroid isomerase-related protein [Rhizobium sp. AAP43]KPF47440.1 isopropylmalate/homocitrate/citramalate synthase [Rhizobium sp. AAP43]